MTLYFVALVLTIGIELAIVTAARRVIPRLRESPTVSTCLAINLLTHPVAALAHAEFSIPFLPVELAVLVTEALGYWYLGGVPARWSILVAFLANVASLIVGVLVF